jgi:hypothetical protein
MIFKDTQLIQEAYEAVQQTIIQEAKNKKKFVPAKKEEQTEECSTTSKNKKMKLKKEGLSFQDTFKALFE